MISMAFLTSEEISNAILQVAENIEQLKDYYYDYNKGYNNGYNEENQNNEYNLINEQEVSTLENNIKNLKWGIISFLTNDDNYQDWLNSANNNSLYLYKYFNKGHFIAEIGPDEQLKEKITNDLSMVFSTTPANQLLTHEERIRERANQTNQTAKEDIYDYAREEKLALNIILAEECFEKEFNYTFIEINAISKARLPVQVNNVLDTIKKNPALLKNSPYHYVVNPKFTEATVNTLQLRKLTDLASLKDATALQQFIMLEKSFHNIEDKNPHKKIIKKMRNNITITPVAPKLI